MREPVQVSKSGLSYVCTSAISCLSAVLSDTVLHHDGDHEYASLSPARAGQATLLRVSIARPVGLVP